MEFGVLCLICVIFKDKVNCVVFWNLNIEKVFFGGKNDM